MKRKNSVIILLLNGETLTSCGKIREKKEEATEGADEKPIVI